MLENTITLFSSDSRPQYTQDIFNVLALPHGGVYRFRYKEKYIHGDIAGDLESSQITGTIALIAFRTSLSVAENEFFFVPVRWAIIERVEHTADFFIIDFVVKDFAVFNKEFSDNCRDFKSINSLARKYFATKDKTDFFVVKNTPNITAAYINCHETNIKEETKRWLEVIEALHIYPLFEKCYFFKASIVERLPTEDCSNTTVIREGGRKNIKIDHCNFCDVSNSEINIEYDKNLLIPSGDKSRKIECRYDSLLFAFQAKRVFSSTTTQIALNCRSSQDPNIETKIRIPLQIKRNYFILMTHVFLSLLGAILIGLPGILPETTPTATTILMFISGSLLIAVNWLIPYKE